LDEKLGVMTIAEALRLAFKEGLDLVEVNPKARLFVGRSREEERRGRREAPPRRARPGVEGFELVFCKKPTPDDPIIPSRDGSHHTKYTA
jgi:hypothetical protein